VHARTNSGIPTSLSRESSTHLCSSSMGSSVLQQPLCVLSSAIPRKTGSKFAADTTVIRRGRQGTTTIAVLRLHSVVFHHSRQVLTTVRCLTFIFTCKLLGIKQEIYGIIHIHNLNIRLFSTMVS